jgi:hypothetical protein
LPPSPSLAAPRKKKLLLLKLQLPKLLLLLPKLLLLLKPLLLLTLLLLLLTLPLLLLTLLLQPLTLLLLQLLSNQIVLDLMQKRGALHPFFYACTLPLLSLTGTPS